MSLPKELKKLDAARKLIKPFAGFFAYFPDAIAAVAQLSAIANEKHNPGEPMHWAKGKSAEQRESQARHMLDEARDGPLSRDRYQVNGEVFMLLHAVSNAWRAMAQLQTLADQGHNIFAEPPALGGLDDALVAPGDFDKKNELYPDSPKQEEPCYDEGGPQWGSAPEATAPSLVNELQVAFDKFTRVTGDYPTKLIVDKIAHDKLLSELADTSLRVVVDPPYRISYNPSTLREFCGSKVHLRDDCTPMTAYFY